MISPSDTGRKVQGYMFHNKLLNDKDNKQPTVRNASKEAVALVLEHGCSHAAAGRSVGVNRALHRFWKRQLEDSAAEAFPGKGKRTVEQQRIHELESENRRLQMEKEI